MSSIRPYSYAVGPFAAEVHCFMLHKRLDFEVFYINPLRAKRDLPVGKQIPVLSVDGESRADSTPIGLWLDELFPGEPRLLPEKGEERDRLMAIDRWISNHLIPRSFRYYPGEGLNRVLNGWKLSYVMGKTARGGLPLPLRAVAPRLLGLPAVRLVLHRGLAAAATCEGLPAGDAVGFSSRRARPRSSRS